MAVKDKFLDEIDQGTVTDNSLILFVDPVTNEAKIAPRSELRGVGITNFQKTAGTGEAGSLDEYTLFFSNGETKKIYIQNGKDGNGDMKASNNLSDLLDIIQARTNISVYSKVEVDTKLNNKINISDIVNNLTSIDENKPLSAKQGSIIMSIINNLGIDNISTLRNTLNSVQQELDNLVKKSNPQVLNEDKEISNNKDLIHKKYLDNRLSQVGGGMNVHFVKGNTKDFTPNNGVMEGTIKHNIGKIPKYIKCYGEGYMSSNDGNGTVGYWDSSDNSQFHINMGKYTSLHNEGSIGGYASNNKKLKIISVSETEIKMVFEASGTIYGATIFFLEILG